MIYGFNLSVNHTPTLFLNLIKILGTRNISYIDRLLVVTHSVIREEYSLACPLSHGVSVNDTLTDSVNPSAASQRGE